MTAFTGYNLALSLYITDGGYIRKVLVLFILESKSLSVGFIWLLLADVYKNICVYKYTYIEGIYKLR